MPDSQNSPQRAELRVTMPQELYDNALKAAAADDRKIGDWIRRLIVQAINGTPTPARRVMPRGEGKPPKWKAGEPNPMLKSKDPVFRKFAVEQEAKKSAKTGPKQPKAKE